MSYKLGLVSVSFRSYTPREILEKMKSCGLTHIEWGSDVHVPPEKASEIKELQEEYDIECCSYGTYFRLGVTPIEELESYIDAAKILGTNVLRLWCGDKNSGDYTDEERAKLFDDCKKASDIAKEHGVVLCMECHNNTYTNTKESAYQVIKTINSENFQMYWQPNQNRSEEENIKYATLLSPYTVHLHVFNWKGKEKFPLFEGIEIWREYLKCFDKDRTLLLEFMPDGKIETLESETRALKEIIK